MMNVARYCSRQVFFLRIFFLRKKATTWYHKAVEQYRKSAEQGNADAQYELGRLYCWGDGVPQNKTETIEWLKMASNQGHVEARKLLATILPIS